jgi:hypothetical protein
MSLLLCLPINSNEAEKAPCFTLFSHLYAEHTKGCGFLQFLCKNDANALAATCREAEQQVESFRWYQFLRRVKQHSSMVECKQKYWISLVNRYYVHIPIIEIVSVMEIESCIKDEKEYMVKLIAENWIHPFKHPITIYVNVNMESARIDTYNFRKNAMIKDVLIDNRRSHVMCLGEHNLNEEYKKATYGELLIYDYTWKSSR